MSRAGVVADRPRVYAQARERAHSDAVDDIVFLDLEGHRVDSVKVGVTPKVVALVFAAGHKRAAVEDLGSSPSASNRPSSMAGTPCRLKPHYDLAKA